MKKWKNIDNKLLQQQKEPFQKSYNDVNCSMYASTGQQLNIAIHPPTVVDGKL
jgi:hypothetical protein